VRLASHTIKLSPEQQRVADAVEGDYRQARAAPPSPEEALGRAGVKGNERHELFQLLVAEKKLLRVRESLYFHADALREIQDRMVEYLRERREIGPAGIKDLFGISRKYAIPLLEYFDAQRVTVRQGEVRVLRGG
jgi:selenocysteine-specific elongation factor